MREVFDVECSRFVDVEQFDNRPSVLSRVSRDCDRQDVVELDLVVVKQTQERQLVGEVRQDLPTQWKIWAAHKGSLQWG